MTETLVLQLLSPFTESKDNMATTYEKIATTTLGTTASSITFSTISAAYTDLRLVFVGLEDAAAFDYVNLRFNSDTGSNYSLTYLYGSGSAASSGRFSNAAQLRVAQYGMSTTIPLLVEADIFSYAGSTYKTILSKASEDFNGSGAVSTQVGLWRSTSAITSITILTLANNFAANSSATLYGILKA
jgi:hypothetical protein